MNLAIDKNGNYICQVCKFVFGPKMVADAGENFNEYHAFLHTIVMKKRGN